MLQLKTRCCTEVFTRPPSPDAIFSFTRKPVERVNRFFQRVFNSNDLYQGEPILASLNKRLEEEIKRKIAEKKPRREVIKKPQLSRNEKVNKKREFIKRVLAHQANPNLREVARYTSSCWKTVRSVRNEILRHGQLTPYEYNNLKSPEELALLNHTIGEIQETGKAVSDIKRILPSFSRAKILEALHERNLRYRQLPRKRKRASDPPNSTRVCRVISHLCQAIANPTVEMLYADEMKFPLDQTTTHSWTGFPDSERGVYNRRPDTRMLTAIVMCSNQGFVGVQVFNDEVTWPDFLYFMNKVIASLPAEKEYSCLIDNASWHKSTVLLNTEVSKFFSFNEPRMFQLNIIENAFSFIRGMFRKRHQVGTMEEEAGEIVRIFFDQDNERRFKGLMRNHLRQLIKYHKRHST
jgi:hypothetical protein